MKQKKGQSLIEVLVAVSMSSLMMVALLVTVSLAIRNSRKAKERATAVDLAKQGVELMRVYRDFSWDDFSSKNNSDLELPQNWLVTDGLGTPCPTDGSYSIDEFYNRCVEFDLVGEEMAVVVTVSWLSGSQELSTNQTTYLNRWGI